MLGLKRGKVLLITHQGKWEDEAKNTIEELKDLLPNTIIDAQHIGSTAIVSIHAKPIIDIVVGVDNFHDIMKNTSILEQHGYIYRGKETSKKLLFVKGDFEKDYRTHHIHVVKWKSEEWYNYVYFRDYLNTFPQKARLYDNLKQKLALQFPDDREKYTLAKKDMIDELLKEAHIWKEKLQ